MREKIISDFLIWSKTRFISDCFLILVIILLFGIFTEKYLIALFLILIVIIFLLIYLFFYPKETICERFQYNPSWNPLVQRDSPIIEEKKIQPKKKVQFYTK